MASANDPNLIPPHIRETLFVATIDMVENLFRQQGVQKDYEKYVLQRKRNLQWQGYTSSTAINDILLFCKAQGTNRNVGALLHVCDYSDLLPVKLHHGIDEGHYLGAQHGRIGPERFYILVADSTTSRLNTTFRRRWS